MMLADEFYEKVASIFTKPSVERHTEMVKLHEQVANDYITSVQRISEQDAAQPVVNGKDDRTLAQVVAHIAEWERFGILAAGDILAGLNHPRSVTDVRRFLDTDGQVFDFEDVDSFNAYQKKKHAASSWPKLQKEAIRYASTLFSLFSYPNLLTADKLEKTKPHRKRLRNGKVIENTTMGWCLWVIYLDHEAVEHAAELKLPPFSLTE
jgi:hypothetical protein